MEWLNPGTVFGGMIVFMSLGNMIMILLRNNWPTTTGKILAVGSHCEYKSDFTDAFSSNLKLFSLPKIHKFKVYTLKYVFVVGKYKYENDTLYSSPISLIPNRRPLGVKIGDYLKVSYCPSNPHSAYLLTSPLWPSALVGACGLALICLGLY